MIHLHDWLTTEEIPFASKLTNTKDHYHHDHSFFEIFYLLEGSIQHNLNGEETLLQTGDIIFLNPEDAHFFNREVGNECRHRDIVIRKSFFEKSCNYVSPTFFTEYTENKIYKKSRLSNSKMKDFEQTLDRISNLPSTQANLIMPAVNVIMAELFGVLVFEKIHTDIRYPDWFSDLLTRFNNPSLIKKGLNAILADSFYTKEHICRVFKKHFGITMTEYLNRQRLDLAANMISYTNQPILAINMDLGFSSVSYFNKIFKERYNISPLEFRKKRIVK